MIDFRGVVREEMSKQKSSGKRRAFNGDYEWKCSKKSHAHGRIVMYRLE